MLIAPAPEMTAMDDVQVEPLGSDVHVWALSQPEVLSQGTAESDRWWALLSKDELERAGRFHFAQHVEAFVANRARLRLLLGQYLGRDPQSLSFTYSETGKPDLTAADGTFFFNLSHTDGLALVAVSQSGRVGVDIEKVKHAEDSLDLARTYFSETELRDLTALDPAEQQAAFYRCWTRKEAFLKALGDGLSRPLSDFSVSSTAHDAAILDCSWDPHAPTAWQLFSLDYGSGYAAALAYEGGACHLSQPPKTFDWSRCS